MNSDDIHIVHRARELLNSGCSGVVGLRKRWGHVGPHVFTLRDSFEDLVLEPRYPMAKVVRRLLDAEPGRKLGVVARGCDVRAIKVLAEDGLVAADSVAFVGLACSVDQAKLCNCEKPIFTMTKCTGCWECVENCPEEAIAVNSCCPVVLPNEFDENLASRRAIYTPYLQAVPRLYLRDAEHCLKLTDRLDCKGCTNICKAEAILDDDHEIEEEVEVGAVVVTPGFDEFLATLNYDFGYSQFPDVMTSMELERVLSSSGPFAGHVRRPSDGVEPKRIAFLQCVGSRDISCRNRYCSSVCCMYAIKEAVIAKEHLRGVDVTVFFMDMRAFGKDFDRYYERAKSEYGVHFVRARVSDVVKADDQRGLTVQYAEEGGGVAEAQFDMVVLSVGLEPATRTGELAKKLGIRLEPNGFIWTDPLRPLETSRDGIFVGGAASGPKDIPETVTQASGSAGKASQLLAEVRNTLTGHRELPPERDVTGQPPRIGVFICHCGINIGGTVDVPAVAAYVEGLRDVVHVEHNLYTCSQDTQDHMRDVIIEQSLNRVIVTSCSPRTHEPLFRETVRDAGLNPYLFEMANIRDQCSWVHMTQPEEATAKAKDLAHMAVAKSRRLEPLYSKPILIKSGAVVVGGGIAGMTAALSLADQGYAVNLVERDSELGGNLRHLRYLASAHDPQHLLQDTVANVTDHPNIRLWTQARVVEISGFVGNFRTTIEHNGESTEVEHGVVIVATGAQESRPQEYLYGTDERVLSQRQLEERLAEGEFDASTVVMIQCVGSREPEHPYCSRVCCCTAVKNALKIKELSPRSEVYILYRDIRTYGLNEELYQAARDQGVVFIRYDLDSKPVVSNGQALKVSVTEPMLERELALSPDLLVLSNRIDPNPDSTDLAQMLKVPLNEDGFFLEAHMKLRPVDFAVEGVFLAGMAHAPKNLGETIAQAEAAAARAATVISKKEYVPEAIISTVDEDVCAGCGVCVSVCSYEAPEIVTVRGKKISRINAALCKGCGACAMACPSGAAQQLGFRPRQVADMISAALDG